MPSETESTHEPKTVFILMLKTPSFTNIQLINDNDFGARMFMTCDQFLAANLLS